jgi:hypothetical protein
MLPDPRHQAAHALLELRQQHYAADDVKRLMSAAFSDETTPPDLRMLIADYLITEFWQSPAGAEGRDQDLYNDAANFAVESFHNSMQQLLNLGWSDAQLVERVLGFCEVDLGEKLIHQIAAIQVEHAVDEEKDQEKKERVAKEDPHKTAELLHSYMEFRAERERQPHELTVEYYRAALDKGFFGVEIGPGMDQRIFCRLAEMGGFVKIILIQ